MRAIAAALYLALAIGPAFAVQPDEILKDAALEARARALSRELRCMVCQNQSIDDSDAPLARDLRLLVRERLTAGNSDKQVIDFLVSRYGEFVLLRPRFEWSTAILWVLPPTVIVVGALALWRLSRRAPMVNALALSAEEEARIEALLQSAEAKKSQQDADFST